jgi:hypothetical protein
MNYRALRIYMKKEAINSLLPRKDEDVEIQEDRGDEVDKTHLVDQTMQAN